MAAPLLDYQDRILTTWREKAHPALTSEIAILKREAGTIERKAAKTADPAERERLRCELEYRTARMDELTRKSAMPCLIAQDVTTERLAVLLQGNREVMFSASADARKVCDNLLGRYNPGKTTDESLYLSGFSGDYVRVDRQGREPVVLQGSCLTVCWFVQPDILESLLDAESLSVSGFLPRTLLCHTRAAPQHVQAEAPIIPEAVRNNWTGLIVGLLSGFHSAETPCRVSPEPEARHRLDKFHNAIVDRRAGADLGDVGPFAARYAEQAWRMAVVLHACIHGQSAGDHQLSLETATCVVGIVQWFVSQQLDILARGRRQAAQKLEDEVIGLLEAQQQRKGINHVTARDVYRARIATTPEAAASLLDRMVREGTLSLGLHPEIEGAEPSRATTFHCLVA